MLQSFVGTYDQSGLRSLRLEEANSALPWTSPTGAAPFWAVLDSSDVPEICRAVCHGRRRRALRLLNERALTLGSLAP